MTSIQVSVRIRPLKNGESATNNMEVIPDSRRVIFGPKVFDCDILLDADTTQAHTFNTSCKNVVDSVMEGQRGTILVYGQTGTGKTHTMFGPQGTPDGVVFNSIGHILSGQRTREFSVSISVLEVYMEKVTDLMAQKEVPVFCGQPRNVVWKPVSNLGEASEVVFSALESRHTASTAMNERSSRSHVIVNVKILRSSSTEMEEDGTPKIESSNLLLVDLAGSECVGKSKAVGKTAHEASSINKSLLALKQIILALSSTSQVGHIPYRDSKLTELLQDSIGGCSRTMMIACISPSTRDLEETKSTLEYATKARQIKNLAQTDRERMLIKIKSLEFELQKARNRLEQQGQERGVVVVTKSEYEELQQMGVRAEELKEELQKQYEECDRAENYRHYHAGVQKQLREEISLIETKLDDAVNERGLTTKRVQESLGSLRTELLKAVQSYEENVSSQMQMICQGVKETNVTEESIQEFMATVEVMSNYVHTSIREIVDGTSKSIAQDVIALEQILSQESKEKQTTEEMGTLLKRLSELQETHATQVAHRYDSSRDILESLSNTRIFLEKRPTDFVATNSLQTAFLKETERYRSSVSEVTSQNANEMTSLKPSFGEIFMRGEKLTMKATMVPQKRPRVPTPKKENILTELPIVPALIRSQTPSLTGKPSAAARSLTSSASYTSSFRSQTPSMGVNAINSKKKKVVFGVSTNITS